MTAIDPLPLANAICKEIVLDLAVVKSGHVRLQTALQYPDGSFIDVFVRRDAQQDLHDRVVLSDFGQTTAYLLDLRIKPWLSAKRRHFLADALSTLGVELRGGALEVTVTPGEALDGPVLRLAQACLRASDLMFTQRLSIETAFKGAVEDFFSIREIPYEPDVEVELNDRRLVRVDYKVTSGPRGALVLALGSQNPASAHTIANELFTRWYDIHHASSAHEARVTVVNDEAPVRSEDLTRLRDLSDVIYLSDEDSLATALAA